MIKQSTSKDSILFRNSRVSVISRLGLFLTCLAVFALFILPALPGQTAEASFIARLTSVEGNVDILRGGNLPSIAAKLNDELSVKDVVRTKSKSRAEITFNDGNILKITEQSRIDISEYDGDGPSVIKMPRGKVQAIVSSEMKKQIAGMKGAFKFEIRTPNAVAGVRGTNFFVYFSNNITGVLVKEGTVAVFNPKFPAQVVSVPAGTTTSVTRAAAPQQPKPASESQMKEMEQSFKPSESKKEGEGKSDKAKVEEGGGDKGKGGQAKGEVSGADKGKAEQQGQAQAQGEQQGQGPAQTQQQAQGPVQPKGEQPIQPPAVQLGAPVYSPPPVFTGTTDSSMFSFTNLIMQAQTPTPPPVNTVIQPLQNILVQQPQQLPPPPPITETVQNTGPSATQNALSSLDPVTAQALTGISKTLVPNEIRALGTALSGSLVDSTSKAQVLAGQLSAMSYTETQSVTSQFMADNNIAAIVKSAINPSWNANQTAFYNYFVSQYGNQANSAAATALAQVIASVDESGLNAIKGVLSQAGTNAAALNGLKTVAGVMRDNPAGFSTGVSQYVQTQGITDFTPPSIVSAPVAGVTKNSSANITLSPDTASYSYTASNGTTTAQGSGSGSTVNLSNLPEGAVTIKITALDTSNNQAILTYTGLTTDYTAPLITLGSTPPSVTKLNAANIAVTSSDPTATLTYSLDGTAVASPTLTGLSERSHTFTVTATDSVGNISTQSYSWTTDYTAPTISLSSTPAATSKQQTAAIGVTSTDPAATFTYTLDGTVVSSPTLSGLSQGTHTFTVEAKDAVGNISTQSYSWTTDFTNSRIGLPTQQISVVPEAAFRFKTGSYGSYFYSYSDEYKGGKVTYTSQSTMYDLKYHPDGTTVQYNYTWISNGWDKTGETSGTWDTGQQLSSLISTLIGASLSPQNEVHTRNYGTMALSGTIALPNTSLWAAGISNPATVNFSGNYAFPVTGKPFTWGSLLPNITGKNYILNTDDGGAYFSGMMGTVANNAVDGRFMGLYIDPSGNTGYLMSSLTGTADATGKFTLSGTTYPMPFSGLKIDLTGTTASAALANSIVSPQYQFLYNYDSQPYQNYYDVISDLYPNAPAYPYYFDTVNAFYGAEGNIKSMADHEIDTFSLADKTANRSYPTGVFAGGFQGEFDVAPTAAWSAKTGNYGAFGAYNLDSASSAEYRYAGPESKYSYSIKGSNAYVEYRRPDLGTAYDIFYNSNGTTMRTDFIFRPNSDMIMTSSSSGTWNTQQKLADILSVLPDSNYVAMQSSPGVPDFGYWLADIGKNNDGTKNGTWNNGKLAATLGGKFITGTKLGTMKGDVLGVYDTTDKTWQAGSLGTFSGTPLKFMSDLNESLYRSTYAGLPSYSLTPVGTVTAPITATVTWGATPSDLDSHVWSSQNGVVQYHVYFANPSFPYVSLTGGDITTGYGPEVMSFIQLNGDNYYSVYNYSGSPAITSSNAVVVVRGGSNNVIATYTVPVSGSGDWWNVFVIKDVSGIDTLYTINVIASDSPFPTNYSNVDGEINAIMGSDTSLWGTSQSAAAPLTIIGSYSSDNIKPHTFSIPAYSYNYVTDKNTTYDGGAYGGYLKGIDINDINKTMDAVFGGLYIAPDGSAGYLKGSAAGNVYTDIGMFEMSGSLYTVPLSIASDVNVQPEDLYDSLSITDETYGTVHGFKFNSVLVTPPNQYDYQENSVNISTVADWGVWESSLSAVYSGMPTSGEWNWSMEYGNPYWIIGHDTTFTPDYSDAKFSGAVYGYKADISAAPFTAISTGDIKGIFDPTAKTFQAVQVGAWLETTKFLGMAATAEGRSKLQQLNIPAIEVGRATLTGSGNGFTNLSMTDTIFFSSAAGSKAQLWATGNVSGAFSAAPYPNTSISLAGGGLSADFNLKTWDTSNGKWLSSINGTGGFNGSTTFRGAGAGTGATYGSGTITGTAAGVAK